MGKVAGLRACVFNRRCRWKKQRGREGHIDIFEKSLRGNSHYTVVGFDDIVTGLAGLFATQSVGEN